jgi:hypothetical protein
MSIVESGKSKRIVRLQGLAGAALVSSAVFMAAPKVAHAEIDYTASGDQSWFNTANWNYGLPSNTTTGTLPEVGETTLGVSANINGNNATMPAVGVLFDPANDTATPSGPNANYIAQMGNSLGGTSFYLSTGTFTTNYTQAAPNKLTIESGTIEAAVISAGRDGQATILLNGGVLITDEKLAVQGFSHSQTIGSGTFEYHGGTYIGGNQVQIGSAMGSVTTGGALAATSAGVGKFVVYNDGADGAILITNGFGVSINTTNKGTIGIVEFHYDLNPEGVGNTRPVQNNFNTTNGSLKLANGTNTSSRLNLVLDAAPTTVGSNVQNLGLFKDQSITGQGTFPKLFYTLTTDLAYTQGATVSATFSGNTYSWTISYSGVITFDNSATSAYSSGDIAATGGTDVVLVGLPVPEPGSLAILGGVGSLVMARRRRAKKA